MLFGTGSFGYIGFQKPAGDPSPPFAADSADNGLSVDPVSGKIVFGNNFADASPGAAVLLNDRKIDFPDATTVRYRMQIPNIQTQDETLDFGGAAGMGITFNGQNLNSPNETQRLPFQAYLSNSRTGGYSVGFQAGRNSQVAVKLAFVDSATQLGGLRGGNLQVLNNSGTATLSQLNFVTPSNGGFVWRIDPTAANKMQMFTGGNLRIGGGADSTGRLQVQGAAAMPIADFADSGNIVRFRINQGGDLSVTTSAGTGVALVKDGSNIMRHVAGFTGTITPVTSITVVSGIVTAVS